VRGLVSYYAFSLKLAFYIAVVTSVAAALVILRSRDARHAIKPVSRVLAVGWVLVIAVATGFPRDWPPDWGAGDLELIPGTGGLSNWRDVIREPNTLDSLLIVLNVVLYVPLAFFLTLAWPQRPGRVLAACVGLSLVVEIAQLVVLDGVAAVDDVFLNMAGAVVGVVLGLAVSRRPSRRPAAG
jgi:drug/metabolite transporter superfamily protein YnfA